MTDILDIKKISENIYNIGCNTFQKDVLYFLWNRFIKNTNDSITDIQNDSKINQRVSEKTKELYLENKSLKSNLETQEKDNSEKENKILGYQEQINILREQSSISITEALNNNNEAKEEIIIILKDNINQLNDNINELKSDHKNELTEYKLELSEIKKESSTKSSYATGLIGEQRLLELLREDNEFTVKDTHGTSHMGDAEILYNDFKICIDAKQYKSACPHKESTKLMEDVDKHGYDGGVLISWDSGIYDPQTSSKIKDILFNKNINGKPYLFISFATTIPESLNIIQNNEKLKEEFSSMIVTELKELDGSDKNHKIKLRRNDERRKHLNSILKEYNLSSCNKTHDIVTEITDILSEIKQEYVSQRNTAQDIKQYIEAYCYKNNKKINNFSISDLKLALNELNIMSEKKYGKNYLSNPKKKNTLTWSIELSPEFLN
jgi:hypothetical protein